METRKVVSRRHALKVGGLSAATTLLAAACGPAAPASSTAAPNPTTPPATVAAAATAAPTAPASGTAAPAAAASPKASGPAKVTLMDSGGAKEQEMFKAAINQTNQILADKKITIEWQPYPGGGWDKIMSMFAANAAYDLQRIDDDRVTELVFANKVWQLDQWWKDAQINTDEFLPLFWTAMNLGGYQFSMEPAVGANVLYYNIDLFKAAGLDLPPTTWAKAWTWDEFMAVAGKLVKKDSSGKTVQYALGFPANVVTPIAYGAGAAFTNAQETQCAMDSKAVADALQPFVDLTKQGGKEWFLPLELDQRQMFNAGKVAMIWDSMDLVANISQKINWDICPWMKTPTYAMTENYDRVFVISKSAKFPPEAFTALMTQCIPPVANVYADGAFGVPYHKATAEGPHFAGSTKPPKNKQVWIETLQLINNHPVDVPTPRSPSMEASKNWFVTTKNLGTAITGQRTVPQFLADGCTQSNDSIKKYNWHAGEMEARVKAAGSVTSPGVKIWPNTPNP